MNDSPCPVGCCAEIISGKWTLLVIRDLILEPTRQEDLNRVIAEGEYYGMQTFDQSLIRRLSEGMITMDEALKVANNPSDMKLQAQAGTAQIPVV